MKSWLALAAALLFAGNVFAAEINDLSTTDASNIGRFPENMNPSAVNDGARALEGMLARGLKDVIDGCVTTAGTATVYTAASNRTLSAYYDGLTLCVKWHAATGASPTINVDSLGAKNILWPDGTALAANDLAINARSFIQYDGTQFQVLTTAPPPPAAPTFTPSSTDTLTNKTIDANGTGNSITNIETADLAAAAKTGSDTAVVTGTAGISGDLAQWNVDGDLVDGPTPPAGTIVGTSDTQTLTNKTLTAPVISTISNTGTVTLPTATDTLVGRATTDTLTNKTLTSPVLNTGVSGTAVLDEDTMASNSATQLATQQSIKAYVDANGGGFTLGTQQSGAATNWDFTGIPAGVSVIHVSLDALTWNAGSGVKLILGDSGGLETTGYVSSTTYGTGAASTSEMILSTSEVDRSLTGTLTLVRQSGNKWNMSASLKGNGGGSNPVGVDGVKTLSGELTQVRLSTSGAFSGGSANITYN